MKICLIIVCRIGELKSFRVKQKELSKKQKISRQKLSDFLFLCSR